MREIIDVHHLIGVDYWLSKNKQELAYHNDVEMIKRIGINAIIYPFPSSENQLYIEENEIIYKCAKENADRVIPVFALNTNYEESYNSLMKYINEFEYFGIVIWPILCDIDLIKLKTDETFINFCKQYDFFIYIHVGSGNEEKIKRVERVGNYKPSDAVEFANFFKRKKIILGHMLRLSYDSLKKIEKLKNVLIDTSGISSQKRWYENGQNVFPACDAGKFKDMDAKEILEYCVKKMKLENKLAFGSSYPYSLWWNSNLNDEINLIEQLDVENEIKDKIFYKNIFEFLGIKRGKSR